jgi:hypothetical protein
MNLIDTLSLSQTLDHLNDCFFSGKMIPDDEKRATADWIAARQGLKGAYAHMFAPTEKDYREGVRVFTGELIQSGAATGHVMGEEACRALLLLNVADPAVTHALEQAHAGILERFNEGNLEQHGRF